MSIQCDQQILDEIWDRYVRSDPAMSGEERHELRDHLSGCLACTRAWNRAGERLHSEVMMASIQAIAAAEDAPAEEVEPEAPESSGPAPVIDLAQERERRRPMRMWGAIALAACVVIAVGLTVHLSGVLRDSTGSTLRGGQLRGEMSLIQSESTLLGYLDKRKELATAGVEILPERAALEQKLRTAIETRNFDIDMSEQLRGGDIAMFEAEAPGGNYIGCEGALGACVEEDLERWDEVFAEES